MNKNDLQDQFQLESDLQKGVAELSRRGFLRAGAVVGTVLASGVFGIKDALAADVKELPSSIRFLTPTEYRVMDKIREVFFAAEKYNMPTSVEIPVIENIDVMVGRLSKAVRSNIGLAVQVFEYSPGYKLKRFSSMSDEDARAYLEKWQTGLSFQRGLVTTLKAVIGLGYWRDQRTWSSLEYDGPVTVKWGIKKLGNAPLPKDVV